MIASLLKSSLRGIALASLATAPLLLQSIAFGGDLSSPFGLETTRVLPKNVRNPRFIDVFTDIDQKFNGSGNIEPLGQPLFKNVTWNQVLATKDTQYEKDQITGALASEGITDLNGGPGNTTGAIKTYANIKVPVLAWGVSERFTLALAIPVVHLDVQADAGFQDGPEAEKLLHAAGNGVNNLKREDTRYKLSNAVNEKLKWAGMEQIHSFDVDRIGDMQLVGKYLISDKLAAGKGSFSIKETLFLPTGVKADPNKALDLPTGEGTPGLGTQAIYNHDLPWDMHAVGQASYSFWMPHDFEKRLPTSDTDSISRDKEVLNQNLRGMYQVGFGIEKAIPKFGLLFSAGHFSQYLTKISYDQGQYAAERYAWLENLKPSETLHSYMLSAGFSSVEWYKKKEFVYPFELKVSYAKPYAGRNATTNEVIAGEFVAFF